MKISIIILNYKSSLLTVQCVKSILDYAPTVPYEILIVDHSPLESGEIFQERCPQARTIRAEHNRGYAAGNNLGIKAATGDTLMIVNPDIIVTPKAIMTLYTAMEKQSDIGMIGPRLENLNRSLQYSCLRFPDWKMPLMRRTFLQQTKLGNRYRDWYELRSWSHETSCDVDWIFGAAMMMRRNAIDEVGLLDENIFLYLEDVDWCRRFWETHWRVVYEPSAVMTHEHKRESARRTAALGILDYPTRIHIQSFIYYMKKYWKKPLPHATHVDIQT